MESRVPFDEDGDNGLVLSGKYLPEELIAEILFNVDCDDLLNCQLVCARWKTLMETYVWRKKAESIFSQSLHSLDDVDWSVYYAICKKRPFERNLLKNCSGQNGINKHWKISKSGGEGWKVESPPAGIPPLPPGIWPFEGNEFCFVTSFNESFKRQIIDLASEGLSAHILDTFQPPIEISEWYGCRFDCGGIYECGVKLLDANRKVLDKFQFRASIRGEARSKWHHISHVFKNYGLGVRKIIFHHAGVDAKFWAGHYGTKMTCATVRVKIFKGQEDTANAQDSTWPSLLIRSIEEPEILPLEPGQSLDDNRDRQRMIFPLVRNVR